MSGFVFKAVAQSVLLFGAETWVFTPHMGRVLGCSQDQVAWKMNMWIPVKRLDGKRDYNLSEVERAEAEFEPMETYIKQRKNTVVQYIATRSLLDFCEAT